MADLVDVESGQKLRPRRALFRQPLAPQWQLEDGQVVKRCEGERQAGKLL